jgi:hypothetical protein
METISTTLLAFQLTADIYREEMRLTIAYAGIISQPDSLTRARDHFLRANAAHFMVGLLLDALEAEREQGPPATQITVEEGSSHLDAPDPEAAAALRLVSTAATGVGGTDIDLSMDNA